MAKVKYRKAERERLGIPSPKNKKRSEERRPRIRSEYMDFSTDRPRRKSSQQKSDGEGLEWIAAAALAVIILGIIVEAL
jgi:hypothetical protein